MCDSDNKNSFTIHHALKVLDEGEGEVGYEYFKARRWLDLTKTDINNQKWTAPGVYDRLFTTYRKSMLQLHPDKGGSGCTETLMLVKKAWDMLKECHNHLIDLTEDSDDEIDDEDDIMSIIDGYSGDENEREVEDDESCKEDVGRAITSGRRTTNNSSDQDAEENESDDCEHRQHDGGRDDVTRRNIGATDQVSEYHRATANIHDTRNPPSEFDHMLGGGVEKVFWFKGVIETIRVEEDGGKIQTLFHARFDDNDEEDYTLHELRKLPKDDACTKTVGNPGYAFWKGFPLFGKVTGIHHAKKSRGKMVPCFP